MTNNDLPPGWAMPEDLAKQVNEALNRKSITPEDELADALDEMARDIALLEPNPVDWGGQVAYLLEQMEAEGFLGVYVRSLVRMSGEDE